MPAVTVGAVFPTPPFQTTLEGQVIVPEEWVNSSGNAVAFPVGAGLAKVNVLLADIVLVK